MEFYICRHCGNVITKLSGRSVPVFCCGEKMTELTAGTSDGAAEKHVPVPEQTENLLTVRVGDVEHPMLEAHFIEWIVVETTQGYHVKHLKPSQSPYAAFSLLKEEKVQHVYAYCNLHGLWKA